MSQANLIVWSRSQSVSQYVSLSHPPSGPLVAFTELGQQTYVRITFLDGDESGVDHLQLEGAAPHPARPHQHLLPPPRPLLLDLRVSHHALWCKAGQVGGMASSDIHQI